jgi:hypothetical protein
MRPDAAACGLTQPRQGLMRSDAALQIAALGLLALDGLE